jgi:hypothetical protein
MYCLPELLQFKDFGEGAEKELAPSERYMGFDKVID